MSRRRPSLVTPAARPGGHQELWSFIAARFGVALPHKVFTPGHSTPMHFVADAFFHTYRDVAAWANRSGLKTLCSSILAALHYLYWDGLEGRVLAGSEDQAGVLYGYWRRWCRGVLAGRLNGPVRRLGTSVGDGRLEILAASQKQVRGQKVQLLLEDELDEIDPQIDAAAVGMIASTETIAARTIYTSTWHRVGGPMERLIDASYASGVRVHKWNIWETIQRCPPTRHLGGRGCRSCPLGPRCLAKAREYHADGDWRVGIAAEGAGLYRVEDAIKAVSKVSQATWEAEYECRRPSADGLVYPQFDPLVHRRSAAPAELEIYRAIDWGLTAFVCLWLGQDKQGRTWLLDTYLAEAATIPQHARYLNAHPLQNVRATYCDPAGRNRNDQTGKSNVEMFREQGIECRYRLTPAAREVRNGIALVRAALSPAAGEPRLFYLAHANNRPFERAMQGYRSRKVNGVWIDEPQDPQEHEHIPDALRYFFVNRQRAAGVGVVRLRTS